MHKHIMKVSISALFLVPFILVGCGGGYGGGGGDNYDDNNDDDNSDNTPQMLMGVLLDSPISGMQYITATQSGQTNAQGIFQYMSGETITFSIGDIEFPSVTTEATITPYDLAGTFDTGNITLINMVRLLQSLDMDGNPDNGIAITDDAHLAATGASIDFSSPTFDSDMDVVNLVANSGSVNTSLVDGNTAIAHLVANINPGTGCAYTHQSIGYVADLSTVAYEVSGQAVIIDDCTIEINNFNYIGGGLPDVRIYGGINGNYSDGFSIGGNIYGIVYNDASLTLTLPSGKTLDDMNGISVWCVEAGANFGDGMFHMP